jgi:GAF domain-containing protein
MLLASALGLWYTRAASRSLQVTQASAAQVRLLHSVATGWNEVTAGIDRMLLTRQTELTEERITADLDTFNERLAQLTVETPGISSDATTENTVAISALDKYAADLNDTVADLLAAARSQRWAEAQVLRHTELASLQRRFDQQLATLTTNVEREADDIAAAATAQQRRIGITFVAGATLAVLIGLLTMVAATRAITTPIQTLIEETLRVIEGDFSGFTPMARRDEIGTLSQTLSVMTEWLRDSYQVLEGRISARTRDLELAADVGRRLARVRDVDRLLQEAVDLIQERFELYYAQVYVVDERGQQLLLRAAAGATGRELLRRGFRLPLDRTSVNGTVAVRREAIVVPDTTHSALFRPNPLLPETRSEMAVPLLAGERVVGVLDLQSDRLRGLTEEAMPAFMALAGQLGIAMENAMLFQEAQDARRELEDQAQRDVVTHWRAFLDAIERDEEIAVSYRHGSPADENMGEGVEAQRKALTSPITLHGQPIGTIEILGAAESRWTDTARETVDVVAAQVARQVETLRLLAEAERYRQDAERALRRLTRGAWERVDGVTTSDGYLYDGNEVRRWAEGEPALPHKLPLLVRGEPVGELVVADNGGALSDEGRYLVEAVAGRLGDHLENLRLTAQTEEALEDVRRRSSDLALLNRIVTEVAGAPDLRHGLQIVVDELVAHTAADRARIALFDVAETKLSVIVEHGGGQRGSALGRAVPHATRTVVDEAIARQEPLVVHNDDELASDALRALMATTEVQSMMFMPIVAGQNAIGAMIVESLVGAQRLAKEDARLIETVVVQASTAIQNARLFEQVQRALDETRVFYQAGAELNKARTYRDVLDVVRVHTVAGAPGATASLLWFDRPWTLTHVPEMVELVAHWDRDATTTPLTEYRLDEYPAAQYLLHREEHVIIEDVATDPRLDPATRGLMVEAFKCTSALAVPLLVGGQWVGHLIATYAEARYFGRDELRRLKTILGQAAVAMQSIDLLEETSRLLESEQKQRIASEALLRASREINTAQTQAQIVTALRRHTLLGVHAHVVGLYLFDRPWSPEQEPLWIDLLAQWRGEQMRTKRERYPFASYPTLRLLGADEPLIIGNVVHDARLTAEMRAHVDSHYSGATAVILLPLLVGGQLVGFVSSAYARRVAFKSDEIRFLMAIAGQAGTAAQGLSLLEQAQARARRERILREVTARVRSATDIDVIMKTAVREVSRALGRDTFVYLGDGGGDGHLWTLDEGTAVEEIGGDAV